MCDIMRGRLLLLMSRTDAAARRVLNQIAEEKIDHVGYLESLDDRLAHLGLTGPKDFPVEIHLLEVPADQEVWKIGLLNFYYKAALAQALAHGEMSLSEPALNRSNRQFTVVPDGLLSLSQQGSTSPWLAHAADFTFDPMHAVYKSSLKLPPPILSHPGVDIAVVDSGIAADVSFGISGNSRNLVDDQHTTTPTDDNGHGTVVALIIQDLAPHARFTIYKVLDASGRASEWDALAALIAAAKADIINVSLAFGLQKANCPICGRESGSARSAVFEIVLDALLERNTNLVVVAAAGNEGASTLAFPARFGTVVAISSVTSRQVLSTFSNHGDYDEAGAPHSRRFALPGGETTAAARESIGHFSSGPNNFAGTSFAAAYGTGLIANAWGLPSYGSGQAVITELGNRANQAFPAYTSAQYGNGLMQM